MTIGQLAIIFTIRWFNFSFSSSQVFPSFNISSSSASPLRSVKKPSLDIQRRICLLFPASSSVRMCLLNIFLLFRDGTATLACPAAFGIAIVGVEVVLSLGLSCLSPSLRTNKMAACCFYSSDTGGRVGGTAALEGGVVGARKFPERTFVPFRSRSSYMFVDGGQ